MRIDNTQPRPRRHPSGGYLDSHGRWVASSPEAQVTPSISKVSGAEHLKVRMGTGRMGAKKYGAPGGAPQATQNRLAVPVIAAVAREMNVSEFQATRMYYALGRVMQRFLLDGRPCGVPHVGIVHVVELKQSAAKRARVTAAKHAAARRDLANPTGHARFRNRPGALVAGAMKTLTWEAQPRVRRLKLAQPLSLRRLFAENIAYTGHWRDHLRDLVGEKTSKAARPHRRRREAGGVDKTGPITAGRTGSPKAAGRTT